MTSTSLRPVDIQAARAVAAAAPPLTAVQQDLLGRTFGPVIRRAYRTQRLTEHQRDEAA